MAKRDTILVVGSINMDMVVRGPHMPAPGETVLGGEFKTSFGGKGANQAVAVARLGGRCRMIGRVGNDTFGRDLLNNIGKEGVDVSAVALSQDDSTGIAMIFVDSNGENSIIVASGANYSVTPDDDIFPNEDAFADAAIVLLQLELPLPTVRAAMDLARRHNCKIILDPAPAPRVMPEDICHVDVISPNAKEAQMITGKRAAEVAEEKLAASDLIAKGAKTAVLKLGPRGCLVVTADGHFYTLPPYKVEVIDTTAAGDAFTGALAVALTVGQHIKHAARFANAAGALACTRIGAHSAMPTADEVEILMQDQNPDFHHMS